MKSRTSFFNFTVLRKDITRYAPVWGLYAIGLLLFLLIPNLDWSVDEAADVMGSSMSSMGIVNAIYGGICALMVFGDLFKTRLCYATHAMPLRREGWFLTHFTAGLLFSIVPNLVLVLCFLPLLQGYWYMGLLWLAASTLQFLFFFGAGAFSAVCAGNRLGAAAAYLIVNFGALLAEWYMENIYEPLLHGVEIDLEFLYYLMPATKMNSLDMVNYTRRPFRFMGAVSADWLYLGIVAAVGILLAVAAMLLYRKRNLESAGDFLSLPAAKPVFLLVYTLSVGYLISVLIPFEYLGLFIGLVIGFFTGKMLLERTVKVFRGWNFLQFGILTTVLAITVGLTAIDAAGLTRYVPETENVESMHFYFAGDRYLYQDKDFDGRTISDPAEIDRFRQFHETMVDTQYLNEAGETVTVYVHYNLKNGMTVLRNYEVPVDTAEGAFTKQQLSCYQSVFHTNDWETFVAGVDQLAVEMNMKEEYFQFTFTDPAQVQGLLAAVKADCDAGNMAQVWSFHQEDDTSSWLYIYDNQYYDSEYAQEIIGNVHRVYSLSLNIYESCENTIAYLETIS